MKELQDANEQLEEQVTVRRMTPETATAKPLRLTQLRFAAPLCGPLQHTEIRRLHIVSPLRSAAIRCGPLLTQRFATAAHCLLNVLPL